MRLSLRFIIPLLVVIAAFAYAVVPLVDKLTLRWFVRDLDMPLEPDRQHGAGVAPGPGRDGNQTAGSSSSSPASRRMSASTPWGSAPSPRGEAARDHDAAAGDPLRRRSTASPDPAGHLLTGAPRAAPGVGPAARGSPALPTGQLVLVHDMSFVERRSEETRKYLFYFFVGLGLTVSLITVVIAQLSWRGWVQGLRALLRGEGLFRPSGKPERAELRPIASDLRALIRDIEAEHRSRDDDQLAWTPETLRAHPARRAARAGGHRGLEPRALHPRPSGRRDRRAAPGERPGHRAGADHARLLRNVDRARQRLRRPRRRGRA